MKPRLASRRRLAPSQLALHAALVAVLVLSVLPFVLTMNLSLKSIEQFQHERWKVAGPFQWGNFAEAWRVVRVYIANSVFVSTVTAVGVVLLSACAGFAFSQARFRGKDVLFFAVLGGMMIPGVLYLVPKFVLVRDLGLMNSRWALLLPYWAEGQVFGIFLFRSYHDALPGGLLEAADVDGAGVFAKLRHIALPLAAPIAGTLAVINVMFTWNDIIWPWIVLSDDSLKTISVGMGVFQRANAQNWGPMFAGFLLASIPLLVLFGLTGRLFVRGFTSGAFKA